MSMYIFSCKCIILITLLMSGINTQFPVLINIINIIHDIYIILNSNNILITIESFYKYTSIYKMYPN